MFVAVQIREREAFIERAKKRVARIDEERQAEVRSVEEAEHKLTQFRALNTTQQEQRTNRGRFRSRNSEVAVGTNAARQRSREDFVPSCVEEMQQWIWDSQQDLQEATVAVARGGGKNLPVAVSRRPRVACRAHGCSDDRVSASMLPSTVGLMVR